MGINEALKLIYEGNEVGYLTIISETRGFIRKIYNKNLRSIIAYDEWESECLDVLVKVVRQFDPEHKTKFSTFYYSAINFKSIDLIRAANRKKELFKKNNYTLSIMMENGMDIVDSSFELQMAQIDIADVIKKIKFNTPLRQAAYLELFANKKANDSFSDRSLKRTKKIIYKEVRSYLNDDNLNAA
jgi:RNA polymerase sigma-70 factor (ECF subfamily)